MGHLDVLLTAKAATERQAQVRRVIRQRRIADDPILVIPFQPGGEAHTLAALAWGSTLSDLHELFIAQPLNRQELFDGLAPFVNWFLERFERAWAHATWDSEAQSYTVDLDLIPQVITTNAAAVAALGRIGRRLAYLPTEASTDPADPPPAPIELVRFGRILRWLAAQATTPGQNLLLDLTSMTQFHWVTVQSMNERAHLGALDAWIEPPPGVDPDNAADDAEQLSIGPYAVPSQEHAISDVIAELGELERNGRNATDQRSRLSDLWHDRLEPVWEISWRTVNRLRSLSEDDRYLPARRADDGERYKRQMEWLDGPSGGRTRTRDTPRRAIWEKKIAEYRHAVLEAEEVVTDPLALVDEILVGKAVRGRVTDVDLEHKEVRAGNKNATKVPVVTMQTDRRCLVPVGRQLWWTEDCGRICAELTEVVHDSTGGAELTLKLVKGMRDGGTALAAVAAAGGAATFSAYTTTQFFPGKLPTGDPFTHMQPTVEVGHLEDTGAVA